MFNSSFDAVGARPGDYYPAALREEIDALNARIYETVNDGVYKAGFASTQQAYEDAVGPLFETLDWLEERLQKQLAESIRQLYETQQQRNKLRDQMARLIEVTDSVLQKSGGLDPQFKTFSSAGAASRPLPLRATKAAGI